MGAPLPSNLLLPGTIIDLQQAQANTNNSQTENLVSQERPYCGTQSRMSKVERLFPLREVPMGGVQGSVAFVNAPLTASEVRGFIKELGNLAEDPVGTANQVYPFLGPNIYTWGEMNSILNILFSPGEVQMIQASTIRIWERDNLPGPQVPLGEQKLPLVDPNWKPNQEEWKIAMMEYMSLIIQGIRESVPKGTNTKLAFESAQEKDETLLPGLTAYSRISNYIPK